MEHVGTWNRQGYGEVYHEGRMMLAHRVAYVEANGLRLADIEGQCVLHSCDNPPCVNPDHLRLGTRAENSADMVARDRAASGPRNGAWTNVNVQEVFRLRREGLAQRVIGRHLGISQSFVSNILNGKAHVERY
jgi:hypothetical protein